MSLKETPQFKRSLPNDWVEFFQKVYTVAEATDRSLDIVCAIMYTKEVEAKLGQIPTPPWHRGEK